MHNVMPRRCCIREWEQHFGDTPLQLSLYIPEASTVYFRARVGSWQVEDWARLALVLHDLIGAGLILRVISCGVAMPLDRAPSLPNGLIPAGASPFHLAA